MARTSKRLICAALAVLLVFCCALAGEKAVWAEETEGSEQILDGQIEGSGEPLPGYSSAQPGETGAAAQPEANYPGDETGAAAGQAAEQVNGPGEASSGAEAAPGAEGGVPSGPEAQPEAETEHGSISGPDGPDGGHRHRR